MPNRRILTTLSLPAALLIVGCDSEAEAPQADNQAPAAASEILGGTISDEMIKYEALQSRAPTIAKEPEGDQSEASDSEKEGE